MEDGPRIYRCYQAALKNAPTQGIHPAQNKIPIKKEVPIRISWYYIFLPRRAIKMDNDDTRKIEPISNKRTPKNSRMYTK